MPRSNQRIIYTILAGLALFAIGIGAQRAAIWADSPSPYPEYREIPDEALKRRPTLTLAQAIKGAKEQQPCLSDEGHDASELCSQWRAADAAQRAARWAWWQATFSFIGITGLGITLWFNLQAWKQARDSQSNTTQALLHAEHSADAMAQVADALHRQFSLLRTTTRTNEQIAETQRIVSAMQLRPYLSVIIGTAIYQESQKPLRFQAIPVLRNSGQTPAQNVRHRIKADVFQVPLPADFVLPEPPEPAGDGFLPPREDRNINAIIDRLINDADVEKVMRNEESGLYVWGDVTYSDAFGKNHCTQFCHLMYWIRDQHGLPSQVQGYYIPGRNQAT